MTESSRNQAWHRVKLGDVVCQIKYKITDPAPENITRYLPGGGIHNNSFKISEWLPVDDGLMGPAFHMRFLPGHTLYKSRVPHGVAVADRKGICANTTYVLESIPEHLIPDLLPFLLVTDRFRQFEKDNNRGSTNLFLNYNQIAEYECPLPPLAEQSRIAELLWAVEEVIVHDKELLTKLSINKRAMFEGLVKNELDNGATFVKLSELMLRSPESGHSPISVDRETGHYVLILSALSPSGYKPGLLKPVDLTSEVMATKLEVGDFLISRSNTVELVGLVGIYDENRDNISFPDTMMRLILDETRIEKRFLEQYLLSKNARRQIQSFAAGTSGSMKKINRSHIAAIRVPFLSIEKQSSIISVSQRIENVISSAENRYSRSVDLRKTILNKTLANCDRCICPHNIVTEINDGLAR